MLRPFVVGQQPWGLFIIHNRAMWVSGFPRRRGRMHRWHAAAACVEIPNLYRTSWIINSSFLDCWPTTKGCSVLNIYFNGAAWLQGFTFEIHRAGTPLSGTSEGWAYNRLYTGYASLLPAQRCYMHTGTSHLDWSRYACGMLVTRLRIDSSSVWGVFHKIGQSLGSHYGKCEQCTSAHFRSPWL